jgi:hypothetical protein
MQEERTTPGQGEYWSTYNRIAYRPSRSRPLSDAARLRRSVTRESRLGPYETSYDIRDGYGLDRPIIQP